MSGFLKSMFKPKMPTIVMPDTTPIPTPEVSAPAEMPTATDSVEVTRAKAAEVRRRMQRGGRASTIMSQASGNSSGGVGSDTYSNSRLG